MGHGRRTDKFQPEFDYARAVSYYMPMLVMLKSDEAAVCCALLIWRDAFRQEGNSEWKMSLANQEGRSRTVLYFPLGEKGQMMEQRFILGRAGEEGNEPAG